MEDKVIQINLKAARDKLKNKGQDALKTTGNTLKGIKNSVADSISDKRKKAANAVLKKGIMLTEKQLNALKKAEQKS